MISLQRKQVAEILDEDRRINRRVFDKEKEQAKVFNLSVKPKSDRDVNTEVEIDRAVERFTALLEKKTLALETLLKASGLNDASFREALPVYITTSDVVSSYNDLARIANKPDLTRDTRDAIKSKITTIQNPIDALVYGGKVVIANFAGRRDTFFARYGLPSVGAYNVYVTIQKQLFRGEIVPLTFTELQNNMAVVKASLPALERTKIARIEASRNVSETAPLASKAKEDALQRRVKMLTAERGRPLSEEELRTLRDTIFGKAGEAYIDPALKAELDRQARIESATKAEVSGRIEPQTFAPAPPVMLTEENPQFRLRVADTIRERAVNAYKSRLSELNGLIAKFDPKKFPAEADARDAYIEGLNETVQEDATTFLDTMMASVRALKEVNDEEYDEDELQQSILEAHPLLTEISNGEENITPANSGRVFKDFQTIAQNIATVEGNVFRAEAEEEVKALRPRPVGEGSARAKAGLMGIGYDDRLNDPYFRY